MKKSLLTGISIFILFVFWQIIALQIDNIVLFPSVHVLLQETGELLITPHFYQTVAVTLSRGFIGLCLSFIFAIGSAFLLKRSDSMRYLFSPWLALMRSVPIISFILLALILIDSEFIPLLIAFLTMYPLLTENILKGMLHLSKGKSIMAKQFKLSFYNRFSQIYYPQLKPYLFSGLISAVGFGWRAIIMGEVLAQCNAGIGHEMKQAQLFISIPELMAWTLVAILISWLVDKAIGILSKWQPSVHYARKHSDPDLRPTAINVKNISYRYAIKNFSYTFQVGKIYALSAPSGCGKTTLFRLLNGTFHPTQGSIKRPVYISNVFQEPELLPHLSAIENVILVCAKFRPREALVAEAIELLTAFGLQDRIQAKPEEMSYGQQQRVSLARALLYPASFLILDEPFKGLDKEMRNQIIRYIYHQQLAHKTILFSSHSEEEIIGLEAETIRLNTCK